MILRIDDTDVSHCAVGSSRLHKERELAREEGDRRAGAGAPFAFRLIRA